MGSLLRAGNSRKNRKYSVKKKKKATDSQEDQDDFLHNSLY